MANGRDFTKVELMSDEAGLFRFYYPYIATKLKNGGSRIRTLGTAKLIYETAAGESLWGENYYKNSDGDIQLRFISTVVGIERSSPGGTASNVYYVRDLERPEEPILSSLNSSDVSSYGKDIPDLLTRFNSGSYLWALPKAQ